MFNILIALQGPGSEPTLLRAVRLPVPYGNKSFRVSSFQAGEAVKKIRHGHSWERSSHFRTTLRQRFLAAGFPRDDLLFAESILSFLGEWEPALQSHKLTGPVPNQLLTTGQPTLKDRFGPDRKSTRLNSS